jgi:hypothetical protein
MVLTWHPGQAGRFSVYSDPQVLQQIKDILFFCCSSMDALTKSQMYCDLLKMLSSRFSWESQE